MTFERHLKNFFTKETDIIFIMSLVNHYYIPKEKVIDTIDKLSFNSGLVDSGYLKQELFGVEK